MPITFLPLSCIHSFASSPDRARCSVLGCVIACTMAGITQAQPTITNLGVLPGGIQSGGYAISADGSAVVGTSAGTEVSRAFRWTSSGGIQDLGFPSSTDSSGGTSISADGAAVAGWMSGSGFSNRAFRWTSAGGMQNLGVFPGGYNSSAQAINGDGSVVVGWSNIPGSSRAFRWTNADGMQDLGAIAGYSGSQAVSADGLTVAGFSAAGGGDHAFRWTSAGGMQDLGALPGGTSSVGYAISGDGLVVAGNSSGPDGLRAFRWSSAGGMQGLGVVSGGSSSSATAISGDGSTVAGWYTPSPGSTRAMLWTSPLGMVDLNTYLPSIGVDLSGWTLIRANGLSFDGTAIVGEGSFNGQIRGWVVSGIPSPPSIALPAFAWFFMGRRRHPCSLISRRVASTCNPRVKPCHRLTGLPVSRCWSPRAGCFETEP